MVSLLNVRRDLTGENPPTPGSGLEQAGILDAFAHDTLSDVLVLAMFEIRPWEGGERQLFQLQEKLNAYASFILDGEMLGTFPQFQGKPVRIEVRTVHEPSQRALDFLGRVKEQLSHQRIDVEVVLIEKKIDGCCGGGHDEAPASGCCGGAQATPPSYQMRGGGGCGCHE